MSKKNSKEQFTLNANELVICLQLTVRQLQDLLTAVRLRRDLDMPGGARDLQGDVGVPRPAPAPGSAPRGSGSRHKRKLIDFNLQAFKKWPANQAIPYMFDGTHSE